MSIRFNIMKTEALLEESKERRNLKWAHRVCTFSRFIHIDVWRFCPGHEHTINKIIPLLRKAQEECLTLLDSQQLREDEKKEVTHYIKNVKDRIRNLEENYLQGKHSAFRPGHTLTEPRCEST